MIKNIEDFDIKPACSLAHLVWGGLYSDCSKSLQKIIYEFTVQYYDLNRNFSFSWYDNGLKGFIFAAEKADCKQNYENFQNLIKNLNENEQKTAMEFYDYLEFCGKETKEAMNDDDVMMGLFVSTKKGCGSKIFEKLVQTCRKNGKKNIYLWTDTVCDYDYYAKHGYIQVKEFYKEVNGRKIRTLVYKKPLNPIFVSK